MALNRPATTRKQSTRGGGSDIEKLKRLGRAIRLLRVSREMTQRDLAKRAGVSQNHIWAMESGKKDPGVLLLQRIASAVEMPLDLFLVAVCDPREGRSAKEQAEFFEGRDFMLSLLDGLAGESNGGDAPKRKTKSRPKKSGV